MTERTKSPTKTNKEKLQMATSTQAPPAPVAPSDTKVKAKPGRKPGQAPAVPTAPATHGMLNLRLPIGVIEEIKANLGGSKYVEQLVINDFFSKDLLMVRPVE